MTPECIKFREEFQIKHFWLVECSCSRFTTLQWTTNATYHLIYRTAVLIYCVCWFIVDLALNTDPYYIAYMTHWGQIIMLLYFGVAFSVAVAGVATSSSKFSVSEDHDSLYWYHKIMWILLNIYVTVAVVITISYWVGVTQDLITPNKSVLSANIHVHVINTALAVIEMTLNSLSIRVLHFYFPVVLGVVYVLFTLILFWAGSISAVYAVLDWGSDPGKAAGVAIGVLALAVPIFHFVITYGLFRVRIFIYKKYYEYYSANSNPVASTNGTAVDGITEHTSFVL